MYCPSCGNELAAGLKYCNRCGESLGAGGGVSVSGLAGPVWAISVATALVTLGGLAMLFVIGLQLITRRLDLPPGAGMVMLAFLAVIVVVDWMLIRQLSRVIDMHRAGGEAAPRGRREAAAAGPTLEEREPARLDAAREPTFSVTDQTTRTLEHAPRERDTRPQTS